MESTTELDFSKPWKMSDVCLIVEDQKFHVHRNVLALWSPVFETMFTSNFREKHKGEIQLPGKSAESMKALLSMIYPPAKQELTRENCVAILELAHEYQIASIVEKCEYFLWSELHRKYLPETGVEDLDPIATLILAQDYELEKLRNGCIFRVGFHTLDKLQNHDMFDEIEVENYAKVLESMIKRMQEKQQSLPSKDYLRGIKAKGIKKVDAIVKLLLKHTSYKNSLVGRDALSKHEDVIEAYLLALKMDVTHHSCPDKCNMVCPGLGVLVPLLKQLKGTLESIIEG